LNIISNASAIAKPIIQPFVVPRPSTIELILSVTVARVWPGSSTGASPAPAMFCEPSGSTKAPQWWIWVYRCQRNVQRGIEWVSKGGSQTFRTFHPPGVYRRAYKANRFYTQPFSAHCGLTFHSGRDSIKPKAMRSNINPKITERQAAAFYLSRNLKSKIQLAMQRTVFR